MRILFLDLDGVVNSREHLMSLHNEPYNSDPEVWIPRQFCPVMISRVNRVVEALDMKIVFSTSWRFTKDLKRHLESRGFKAEVLGRTPRIDDLTRSHTQRGDEIQAWMTENGIEARQILILDDDGDMGHLLDRMVRTSFLTGMTDQHVEKCLRMFA